VIALGLGQPANFVEAIRLYRLAQNQGSVEAKKMLELIFSRPGPNGQVDVAWMQELAYVNLAGRALSLDSTTARSGLRREPTPLFDLLPSSWQKDARPAPRQVR
jgi:TPR repeat protein